MTVARSLHRALILALAMSAGVVSDVQAQRLGRLLTSAEERAALDELRRQAGIAQPVVVAAPEPEAPAPPKASAPAGPSISSLKINGVVRRSGGQSSVWVNGDLLERGDTSREGVAVESGRGLAGSVRLRLPSGAGTVALRPGQQIDIDSGALLEAYEKRRTTEKGSAFVPREPSGSATPATMDAPSKSAAPSSESNSPAATLETPAEAGSDESSSLRERLESIAGMAPKDQVQALERLKASQVRNAASSPPSR